MRIAVGFSWTNTLVSKGIRWFTKSQVSHVYIRVYDSTFKTYFILHSDMPGVVFTLAEQFDKENTVIEEYIISDPRLDEALRKNLWHLGKKYDYVKIVNLAWAIILKRWFVRKIKNPEISPKSLICVDFVLYVLNDAGLTELPIGNMTQLELKEWFVKNHEACGWKRIVHDNSKTLFDHVRDFLSGV